MVKKKSAQTASLFPHRSTFVMVAFFGLIAVLIGRLFYWQVIKSTGLQIKAQEQYQRNQKVEGQRGSIYTSDGYLLVGNQTVYRLFAEPPLLKRSAIELATLLTPQVIKDNVLFNEATESARKEEIEASVQTHLTTKLEPRDAKWVGLSNGISETTRQAITQLNLEGISFEPYLIRDYPEASLAAHVTGFVGKNEAGQEVGYFGVEGALDQELRGRVARQIVETDALGLPFLSSHQFVSPAQDGRNVVLTIRRDVQYAAETMLEKGIERYGAKAGEVVIMEPSTGKILALATWPHYDQATFADYPTSLYKNPALAELYEPGSTFKTLTVASGIEEKTITPETICPICEGPRLVGEYSIRTWNNQYNPNVTMTDALAKSDNVAMTYIAEKLGAETFEKYLHQFEIGEKVGIDLQEDKTTPFPTRWGTTELFTRSFGQGITTNSLQLIKAVGALANHGQMMRPYIIEKVTAPTSQEEHLVQPLIEKQVVSPETAHQVSQMMVHAAQKGEAQWTASTEYTVAAKTGTSQVVENGQYAPDKTITSFIGFVPADKPAFIMLVKLVEPTTSPWAAETAAPLWYRIAEKLYLLLSIPPDTAPTKP